MAVTATEARKSFLKLIEQVNNDCTVIEITSKRGNAVLLSRAEYDALNETAYLLRSPANGEGLLESLRDARAAKTGRTRCREARPHEAGLGGLPPLATRRSRDEVFRCGRVRAVSPTCPPTIAACSAPDRSP